MVKRKTTDLTPFVLPDWTKLYQKKVKEAALKTTPVVQLAPVVKPYRKMRAIFDNLTEEDLEDLEDLIFVPINLVKPSATLSQPAADDKVEEVTPSSEPTEEKKKADYISPTDHTQGEATESVSTQCAMNEETLVIINLKEPVEDSNTEKVVETIVREEVEEPIIDFMEIESDTEKINHVLADFSRTLFEESNEEPENSLAIITYEGPILSADID
ncbi:hypothetical protein SESBI_13827 [Sesbania bispinosa]|nr:hypothetical protein SESBI_13827 [Sesbania bispinosa]